MDFVFWGAVFEMLEFKNLILHHLPQSPGAHFSTICILCNVNVNGNILRWPARAIDSKGKAEGKPGRRAESQPLPGTAVGSLDNTTNGSALGKPTIEAP